MSWLNIPLGSTLRSAARTSTTNASTCSCRAARDANDVACRNPTIVSTVHACAPSRSAGLDDRSRRPEARSRRCTRSVPILQESAPRRQIAQATRRRHATVRAAMARRDAKARHSRAQRSRHPLKANASRSRRLPVDRTGGRRSPRRLRRRSRTGTRRPPPAPDATRFRRLRARSAYVRTPPCPVRDRPRQRVRRTVATSRAT